MSLFDVLESRMQGIFEGRNVAAPIPFKKLAKQATHEMKRRAVKTNGGTMAPTLYTVLVSPADDAMIAPLYQQVTSELADFLGHEAQNAGLVLTGAPVVRFIADQNVHHGRMDVIAEVVTPEVLETLRVEEADYMRSRMASVSAAMPQQRGAVGVQPIGGARQQPAARPQQGFAQPAPATGAPMTATGAPMARTCELRDVTSGKTWRVGVDSTVIGRDESMADLVLQDTNVSRRHAQLTREPNGWVLTDLGSTNGTRVNGARLAAPYVLKTSDTIQMGLITLAFREL